MGAADLRRHHLPAVRGGCPGTERTGERTMSRPEALALALTIGSLFGLAIFCEPPRFMVDLFGWIRSHFTRGRHHVHAALPARPFERERRPTVAAIAARLRREARREARGAALYAPALNMSAAEWLGIYENPEQFA
jgi:hypothetical protein